MKKIYVQRVSEDAARVEQLKGTRDWMDATYDKHAYSCFPLTLTNRLGWGISFDKDIRVIWDGIETSADKHVTILEGEEYVYTGRSHASLSFKTGLVIKTDEDVSTLTMPVPNQFIRGAQVFTTLMSTSFYGAPLPLALKILEPHVEIFIPAHTPVAAIIPISISSLQNDYEMEILTKYMPQSYWDELSDYGDAAEAKNSLGDWSNMYRDAVNQDGEKQGKHEAKSIKLKTITCPVTGATVETAD